jgi:hypothetical protein
MPRLFLWAWVMGQAASAQKCITFTDTHTAVLSFIIGDMITKEWKDFVLSRGKPIGSVAERFNIAGWGAHCAPGFV